MLHMSNKSYLKFMTGLPMIGKVTNSRAVVNTEGFDGCPFFIYQFRFFVSHHNNSVSKRTGSGSDRQALTALNMPGYLENYAGFSSLLFVINAIGDIFKVGRFL